MCTTCTEELVALKSSESPSGTHENQYEPWDNPKIDPSLM